MNSRDNITEIRDKKKVIHLTSVSENSSFEFREIPFRYVGNNSYLIIIQTYEYNDIWEQFWTKSQKKP